MTQTKEIFLYCCFLLSIVIIGCRKAKAGPDPILYCSLYSEVSSDTNYIPHKKGNYWNYCLESSSIAWSGLSAKITLDTVIRNRFFFVRSFDFTAGQSGAGAGTSIDDLSGSSMIDSLGNYYFLKYRYTYDAIPRDTILIIKPSAMNGDTIYNNIGANVKVVLIDKNETFRLISGCYHSRVMLNANSS